MNSTSDEQSISPGATAFYCVVMGAILATAIFGNCLVLLAVKRTRSLRNTAAVLVVNLACVDLAVTIFIVPFVIVTASEHQWLLSSELCVATGFMNSFLTAAQIMALLHISVNRFLAVSYPHSYDTKLSKRLTLMMVGAGWVYSFFWTHMPFYGWGAIGFIDGTLFCNILWSRELSFAVSTQVLCYFLPCTIAGVLYLLTYLNVRKRWRRAKVRTQSTLSLGETNTALAVTQSMEALATLVTPSIEDLTIKPVTQPLETLNANQSNETLAGDVTHSPETLLTLVTQSVEKITDQKPSEDLNVPKTQSASLVTQSDSTSAENGEYQSVTQSAESTASDERCDYVMQSPRAGTPQATRKSAETVTVPVTEVVTQHADAVSTAETASETSETQYAVTMESVAAIEGQVHPVVQCTDTIVSSIDETVTPSSNSDDIVTQSDEMIKHPSIEVSLITQSSETSVTESLDESLETQQNGAIFKFIVSDSSDVTIPVTQSLEAHHNGTNVMQSTETSADDSQGNDTCRTTQDPSVTQSDEAPESVTQTNEMEPINQSNIRDSNTEANGVVPVTQYNGNEDPATQSNGSVVTDVVHSKEPVSTPIVHFAAASPHALDMTFLEEGNSMKATGDAAKAAKAARTRRRRRRAMENRVTKTLLGVAIAFAVCWFPRGVANLWALVAGRDKVPLGLEFVSTAFVFLNSSVNPAVYGALNHDFYKAFISILSCQKAKRSRSETELGSGSFSYARRI